MKTYDVFLAVETTVHIKVEAMSAEKAAHRACNNLPEHVELPDVQSAIVCGKEGKVVWEGNL